MVCQIILAQSNTNNATSDEARALNDKCLVLNDLGRSEEAIVAYDKALAIDPNNLLILDNKKFAVEALS
jgi:Flp pilus assembly protein TadD